MTALPAEDVRTRWVSAHLFYQGDLDVLLLELVDPLLHELRAEGLAEHAFFLRYWDGGPHLRLRLLPCPGAVAADVADVAGRVTARSDDFFTRRPAPDLVRADEYRSSARAIGAWEGVAPVEHMYPNNSVQFLPYRPEHGRYGRGPALAAVEEHFAESSRLAMEVLRAGRTRQQRETAVIAYLMTAWLLGSPDVQGLARRQLAMAEGWARPPGTARTDDVADALYTRQRETLRVLTDTAARTARSWSRLPADGGLTRWAASLARLVQTLRSVEPDDAPPSVEGVADVCAHLLANRLGVRIDTEGSLRYLAARAVTEAGLPAGTGSSDVA